MRSASIAMLIVCCSFSTFCGNPALIGNLRLDLLASANDSMITSGEMPKTVMEKKNPLVTGLYSLVIPGAGEFTTENYTKSAIFLSVEDSWLLQLLSTITRAIINSMYLKIMRMQIGA